MEVHYTNVLHKKRKEKRMQKFEIMFQEMVFTVSISKISALTLTCLKIPSPKILHSRTLHTKLKIRIKKHIDLYQPF